MNTGQLTDIVKRVSAQRTEDTSLLSEERYPMDLSSLFENLTTPTSLQDALSLLQWNRTRAGSFVDKSSHERAKAKQNNLRKALQLAPDTDSPWGKVQFQDWKDKITVICLSAVQKVVMTGINQKNHLSWIHSPKLVDSAVSVRKQAGC
jgi:hypothetical protein